MFVDVYHPSWEYDDATCPVMPCCQFQVICLHVALLQICCESHARLLCNAGSSSATVPTDEQAKVPPSDFNSFQYWRTPLPVEVVNDLA